MDDNAPDLPHTWNDRADQISAEVVLADAQDTVSNLWQLLDAAADEMNAGHAPMRAVAMVEIARDTARALANRLVTE